jgi:hypothetical protein
MTMPVRHTPAGFIALIGIGSLFVCVYIIRHVIRFASWAVGKYLASRRNG